MSYARFGWDGSDVYVFGGTWKGENYIECCGCILTADWRKARTDEERAQLAGLNDIFEDDPADREWDWGPVHHYATKAGIVGHLRDHIAAGHTVPDDVIPAIEADDWTP